MAAPGHEVASGSPGWGCLAAYQRRRWTRPDGQASGVQTERRRIEDGLL